MSTSTGPHDEHGTSPPVAVGADGGVSLDAFGIPGSGADDASGAFQAAVDDLASRGGGLLVMPAGRRYRLDTNVLWRSGVSLRGAGWGAEGSVLAPTGDQSAIRRTTGSTQDTLDDCHFTSFEVDGGDQADGDYTPHTKALYLLYMRRAVFRDLYIHDTWSTGLGCDYLRDSVIDSVIAERCGRGATDPNAHFGASGIGIGTGAWPREDLTIVNCTGRGNGNYGIFVERQRTASHHARGIRIVGCTAEGNRHGIADYGCDRLIVANCVMVGNAHDGFHAGHSLAGTRHHGRDGVVTGCQIHDNARHGVTLFGDGAGGYTVAGTRISRSGAHGVCITSQRREANHANPDVTLRGLRVEDSGHCGIYTTNATPRLRILDVSITRTGMRTGGMRNGVRLESQSPDGEVRDVTIRQAGDNEAAAFLLHDAGALTDGRISGLDTRGHGIGAVIDGSITGTYIYDNPGAGLTGPRP